MGNSDTLKKLAALGLQSQLDQTQEECGELITAVSKYRRKHDSRALAELIEEIADVTIMIRQLNILLGQKEIDAKIAEKLARSKERLENGTI